MKNLALILLLAAAGCKSTALVTESKINFVPATGALQLSLPKDASWGWLFFQQDFLNPTNGWTNHISLVISNGVFRNNPMVLDAQTARDIGMINAFGTAFQNGVQAGAAGATKAVVPVPTSP